MANIADNGTHFTFRTPVGSIGDSFYFFPHWYKDNYVLITLVQGKLPSSYRDWLSYLDGRGIEHELMSGACLVMPGSTETLFLDEGSFKGNSEIYVCHKKPVPDNIPAKAYPADVVSFSDSVPEGFLSSVRALDALVYISECSAGLNIAHKAKEEIIFFVRELS